jgi:hypothetical protein
MVLLYGAAKQLRRGIFASHEDKPQAHDCLRVSARSDDPRMTCTKSTWRIHTLMQIRVVLLLGREPRELTWDSMSPPTKPPVQTPACFCFFPKRARRPTRGPHQPRRSWVMPFWADALSRQTGGCAVLGAVSALPICRSFQLRIGAGPLLGSMLGGYLDCRVNSNAADKTRARFGGHRHRRCFGVRGWD